MFTPWTVGAQVILPLGLLAWIALGHDRSRADWALRMAIVTTYVGTIALAGLWPVRPWLIPGTYMAALIPLGARAFRRVRAPRTLPSSRRGWLGTAARGTGFALVGTLAWYVLLGRRAPSAAVVDLTFPLDSGTYYVVNGGSRQLINAHLMTLSGDRFRKWRGQSYGVDILELNRVGLRARGLLPRDPRDYAIFGQRVLAPCTGSVVAAADGLRDLSPPAVDREHMAGNHVILACGDAWVVLAHLREGSVCVSAGDSVRTGQPIGQVGNTGNTNEPHLHIHAQRPGSSESPLGGAPLVTRFDGRYLVRNARVKGSPAP